MKSTEHVLLQLILCNDIYDENDLPNTLKIVMHMSFIPDQHYVLSSERDHARATFKAHTSTNRVVSSEAATCHFVFSVNGNCLLKL